MHQGRIRNKKLEQKIMSADEAAGFIKDKMTVGMSGFTRAGDAKALPFAMARRAAKDPFSISLLTGASLGHDVDKILFEANITKRRLPFQVDTSLRHGINTGEVMFIDQHLSETVEQLRAGQLPKIDCAIIEAVAINEKGGIIPSTSIGNSASFAMAADQIIIEINLSMNPHFEGLHDVYLPQKRPGRTPIELLDCTTRLGLDYIPVDPEKIVAIVITDTPDSPSNVLAPDEETKAISKHLIRFFEAEVAKGRMGNSLCPLQAGIGTIANAVLQGLAESPFDNLVMYSEVLQDSTFDLFDAGKLNFASACSITLSERKAQQVFSQIEDYKDRLILRPQEISNHPEILRRLGLITMNTALECDIYGNVNSTHLYGTHMMNGIGGSGDFARNAFMSIFITKSMAKEGKLSSIVPMVTHVDHSEHDVDIIVTENGLADLRGLAPRERAPVIINNCADEIYRAPLLDYFERAKKLRGGQTPHLLDEAFSWHLRYMATGNML